MTTRTAYRRDERRPVDDASCRCHEIFAVNGALRDAGVPMEDMARMQLAAIHTLAQEHSAWAELRPAPATVQPNAVEAPVGIEADPVPEVEETTVPQAQTDPVPAPADDTETASGPAPETNTSRAEHLAELAEKRREARLRRRMARLAAEEGDL